MIVPTISDEYQIFEWALRQKYNRSLSLPSSFQPVLTADTMATIIPCATKLADILLTVTAKWRIAYQTHREAETNFFHFAHIQVPRDEPRERRKNKVHNNVVHWLELAK